MKKIILTLLITANICYYANAQRSHEEYSNDEILKLSNYIVELERKDSANALFQKKLSEVSEENVLLKARYTQMIDSFNNVFKVNYNAQANELMKINENKNDISEDDVIVEKDMLVYLKKVQFDVGSYKIEGVLAFKLDIVSDVLKKFENTKFEILAYADTTGSAAFNLSLSKKRAHAVKNYLVSKGISAQRLIAIGLGEELPNLNMNIVDAMRESRRAEIRKLNDQKDFMVNKDKKL